MSRALTLGNGRILVGINQRSQVQDFYFPYVGLENHISGHHIHRVGVFVDGAMHWLDDPAWQIDISCGEDSLAGNTTATHEGVGVRLHFFDIVYNEKDIFIREIMVENLRSEKRTIKIFFGQQFQISESRRGDTGYYDPRCNAIIHYKGRRVFLINAVAGKAGFDDYAVGLYELEGYQGTHVDAEDGELSKNPIEHGLVDSMVGISLDIAGGKRGTVHYWITAGHSIDEVRELNAYVIKRKPGYLMKTAGDFWRAWVNKQGFSFYGLDDDIVSLFKKSLLIVRAHVDNSGAIIASSDSGILQEGRDTYSYMWPRDGARSAAALNRAGDFNVARRFFEFCNDVITEEGFFMHKYRPDKSLGSSWHPWVWDGKPELPIQEDETALVLTSLWKHYDLSKDIEFIESIYNSLIKKSADFLMNYVYKDIGLPYPSYDLWEEKYGITTFSCAVKYDALLSAGRFAKLLGKTKSERAYTRAAQSVKRGMLEYLYNEEQQMFYKLVNRKEDGEMEYDATIDMSSIFSVYAFNLLDASDERVRASIETIKTRLALPDGTIGGVPRYEHDGYYKSDDAGYSNPWFVTTLWLAQYYIKIAQSEKDLEPAIAWMKWAVAHALPSGVLSEQLHPLSGQQLSVAPLTWSHSEFIITVIDYLEKLEELGVCKACYPVG